MTGLAVFDIDGTLTDTNSIDSECFVEALREEYAIGPIDEDWSIYKHTTDRGIAREILHKAWSREADEAEIVALRDRFVALLEERMTSARAIPGAVAFLDFVTQHGWDLVLCTGAWSASARLKLQRAGFPSTLPLSSCDDAESREDIVRNGIATARRLKSAVRPAEAGGPRVVVFGDASWDLRAARALDLPFIGIGPSSGSRYAIDDYTDAAAVLALMDEARAPR